LTILDRNGNYWTTKSKKIRIFISKKAKKAPFSIGPSRNIKIAGAILFGAANPHP